MVTFAQKKLGKDEELLEIWRNRIKHPAVAFIAPVPKFPKKYAMKVDPAFVARYQYEKNRPPKNRAYDENLNQWDDYFHGRGPKPKRGITAKKYAEYHRPLILAAYMKMKGKHDKYNPPEIAVAWSDFLRGKTKKKPMLPFPAAYFAKHDEAVAKLYRKWIQEEKHKTIYFEVSNAFAEGPARRVGPKPPKSEADFNPRR